MKPPRPAAKETVVEYRGDGLCITVGRRGAERAQMKRTVESADLVQCAYCAAGFRRVDGVHIGSQRLGMIPSTTCDRVFAQCDKKAPTLARSWTAYVDGALLRKSGGEIRYYTSASTALRAARKASPRRWHP